LGLSLSKGILYPFLGVVIRDAWKIWEAHFSGLLADLLHAAGYMILTHVNVEQGTPMPAPGIF
jgi:hypothetical protein